MIDPRIERGTRALLELRARRLAAGERPIGWKVGFGAPASLAKLGIDRPLVGFLTDRGVVEDGATVAVGGWTAPMIEPEIAVHLGPDAKIAGLSAAIELADLHTPPADPEEILAGNIYHRHVILGPVVPRSNAEGVSGWLLRDGEEIARNDTPAALTGNVVDVVRLTGELLAACGEQLRAGDVIITGSIVPPVPVAAGQHLQAELHPLGKVAVTLRIG